MSFRMEGRALSLLYNPEAKPDENGSAPYLGPWMSRVKDGRALFQGQRATRVRTEGPTGKGNLQAPRGPLTRGWQVDLAKTRIDTGGIALVSFIETGESAEDPDARPLPGPARTELVHRLEGATLHIESLVTHLSGPGQGVRLPVLAAVHPWFLLDPKNHALAEVRIPARRRRVAWPKRLPGAKRIPWPLPALPILRRSRHFLGDGRALGPARRDDTYAGLRAERADACPVARIQDRFRGLVIEVGLAEGYDELTLYAPGGDANGLCLEPQTKGVSTLGLETFIEARVPSIGPGESFRTHAWIRASPLAARLRAMG
jgi:galactose mutarotase-like enzyme